MKHVSLSPAISSIITTIVLLSLMFFVSLFTTSARAGPSDASPGEAGHYMLCRT